MAVLLAPLGEGLGVGVLGLRTEQPGLLPVPGDALAPEIAEMGGERRRAGGVADDAGLHRDQTRAAGQQMVGPHAGDAAAAEGRAAVRCVSRPCRETPPPARWAAASAWAMKGLARWLREERMRPGRGWKSFSSAIAGPGNVRKTEDRAKR